MFMVERCYDERTDEQADNNENFIKMLSLFHKLTLILHVCLNCKYESVADILKR